MNNLLLFFAFPVATIILAVVLEKIVRNPFLTAATFFAIYLIVTFTAFNETFLVYTIAYTILAFISAIIAEYFFRRCEKILAENNTICDNTNKVIEDLSTNNSVLNNRSIGKCNYHYFRR